MPMDEYDMSVSKFDYTIDVYQNDSIQKIISEFLNKVSTTKHEIEIRYQKLNQFEEDEYVSENITNTVNKLRNALDVLESRIVTNIGGKVAYHVVPEKYDPELGYNPKWILVQVHRGYRYVNLDEN
jgi:hypothetical protein